MAADPARDHACSRQSPSASCGVEPALSRGGRRPRRSQPGLSLPAIDPRRAWARGALCTVAALVAVALPASAGAAKGPFLTGFSGPEYTSGDQSERGHWFDQTAAAAGDLVRINVSWRDAVTGQPADQTNPLDPAYNFASLRRRGSRRGGSRHRGHVHDHGRAELRGGARAAARGQRGKLEAGSRRLRPVRAGDGKPLLGSPARAAPRALLPGLERAESRDLSEPAMGRRQLGRAAALPPDAERVRAGGARGQRRQRRDHRRHRPVRRPPRRVSHPAARVLARGALPAAAGRRSARPRAARRRPASTSSPTTRSTPRGDRHAAPLTPTTSPPTTFTRCGAWFAPPSRRARSTAGATTSGRPRSGGSPTRPTPNGGSRWRGMRSGASRRCTCSGSRAPPPSSTSTSATISTTHRIRAARPTPGSSSTRAAPSRPLTAWRFPFVVDRKGLAWGRSPQRGKVKIQRRGGSGWRTVVRKQASAHAVFKKKLGKVRTGARFRGGRQRREEPDLEGPALGAARAPDP